jgi:RAB protein geranylgeranyltransferase component A
MHREDFSRDLCQTNLNLDERKSVAQFGIELVPNFISAKTECSNNLIEAKLTILLINI